MNTFMISFLSVSVSGLCMAGIVVLLEKLLKNHLSFRFRYGLWLALDSGIAGSRGCRYFVF